MRLLTPLLLAAALALGSAEDDALARLLAEAQGATDAASLQRIAEECYGLGSAEGVQAALQVFERALAMREARAAEEPGPLADLLHDLSGVHFNRGDYAAAEEAERRALEIRARLHGDTDVRTAESRRDLALVYLFQGRLAEAAAELPRALSAIEAAAPDDFDQVAIGRNYLAELYRLQGRSGEAARVLEELVRRAEGSVGPDHPRYPHFLNNLAGIYRDQERFDEAETLLRRSLALRLAATPRDDGDVAAATLNLAELYRVQGKPEEAGPLYAEALALARSALGADSPELLEFVNQQAVLHREEGRLPQAEAGFREALALVERGPGAGHPRAAQTRLDLAELLRLRGRCGDAEVHYREAIAIREAALGPDHADVAEALVAQSRCLSPKPARGALDRALTILEGSEAHRAAAVDALALRADLRRAKDPEGARADLEGALGLVETMRPHRGGGEGVRAEFFGRHRALYERRVRWDVEAGEPARALEAAERGRARALLDQLAAGRVGEPAALPADLQARRAAAHAQLAEARARLAFEQARADLPAADRRARTRALEKRLDEATAAFRLVYDEGRNASPAWRRAAAGAPATAAEIQAEVVPREGRMLLYAIGETSSFVFTVGAGEIEARRLAVSAADAVRLGVRAGPLTAGSLEQILSGSAGEWLAGEQGAVVRGIGGLSARPAGEEDLARLHALWRVLIPSGLWPRLTRAREVLVVPDGALFQLPLEALVVRPGPDVAGARFWLDLGPVLRYAPSATLVRDLSRLTRARQDLGPPAALSVADPAYPQPGPFARLPGAAAESGAVRAALEGVTEVTVLLAADAREPEVRRALPGKRYIHLASHGLVDDARGELFAALALTPPPSAVSRGEDDGFLHLFEIYDLPLSAELAVLSACGSNRGRLVAGEGIFALSRGFLVAGARRVVASQWPVDDASTAALVGDLFRRIAAAERGGGTVDAARALRDAKLRVRARPEWAHPFHWAPFVLTGVE